MQFFLEYALLAVPVMAAAAFFYRTVSPVRQPDFRLKSFLEPKKLYIAIGDLAQNAKVFRPRGAGLSVRLIQQQLGRAFRHIEKKAGAGEELYGFERWIYDNHYKLFERAAAVKHEVHKFMLLPHIGAVPRVYEFAEFLVKSQEGFITYEILRRAAESYNAAAPLQYAEITALRFAIEYALLEFVAIFCAKSVRIGALTKSAASDAAAGRVDLAKLRYNSYVAALYQKSGNTARRNIAKLCLYNGADIEARAEHFFAAVARYDGMAEAAIKTLHKAPEIFTDKNVLGLSPVHETLSATPGILYGELAQASKFLYLSHIGQKARKEKISELAFASAAVEAARRNGRDVSFEILPKEPPKPLTYLYIAAYGAVTFLLSAAVWFFAPELSVAAGILSLPVSFVLTGVLASSVLKRAVKRRQMPEIDLKAADRQPTALIVVPRLIAARAEITDALRHIETIIAANRDGIVSYALLFDLPESRSQEDGRDAEFLEFCRAAYEACAYKERLALLVRNRKKVAGEGKFRGWEKKRGALIELNGLILGGGTANPNICAAFRQILGEIKPCAYVVTLDCDTLINLCFRLVQIMEHPFNRAKNILSVKISSRLSSAKPSAFSQLFCGASGLSNYTPFNASGVSDWFGHGNFTGKGIYRVREFQEKIAGKFLDNRVLSHDYIEGCFAGCADSSVLALDGFPPSFGSYLARQTRWLRGDWQNLPFLFRRVRGQDGKRYKNPVSAIGKWHIFSNLVISLAPVCSFALIILALFCAAPLVPLVAAFAVYGAYMLKSVRASVLHRNADFAREFLRQFFLIAAMPVIALYALSAIILTLWRLLRRKKLLEWRTFSHESRPANFLPAVITAAAFAVFAFIFARSPIFYAIAGLFLLGYFTDFFFSAARKEKPYGDTNFRERLAKEFHAAYRYFIDFAGHGRNFLPCDNAQLAACHASSEPHSAVPRSTLLTPNFKAAERTSPTNIGFALTAHMSAFVMGEISYEAMTDSCEKIIGTVEKMEKWHGNLYNWTDIRALTTLQPRYVSAVDSGNFLIALTLLLQYAEGELNERVDKLVRETEIERLFDAERGLFRIGFNDGTGELDPGHYDLMASEAAATYLIAAAHGKIGAESFLNLSRQSFLYGGRQIPASWTGGMFEYLMTGLFFEAPYGSVYRKASRNAVRAQTAYAKKKGSRRGGYPKASTQRRTSTETISIKRSAYPKSRLQISRAPPSSRRTRRCWRCLIFLTRSKKTLQSWTRSGCAGNTGITSRRISRKTRFKKPLWRTISVCRLPPYAISCAATPSLKSCGNIPAYAPQSWR